MPCKESSRQLQVVTILQIFCTTFSKKCLSALRTTVLLMSLNAALILGGFAHLRPPMHRQATKAFMLLSFPTRRVEGTLYVACLAARHPWFFARLEIIMRYLGKHISTT